MELTIIGYGNMAKAILQGLLQKSKTHVNIQKIRIVGRNPHKIESWLESLLAKQQCEFIRDKDIILQKTLQVQCDKRAILLACKPYNLRDFSFNGHAQILYSVLAGIGLEELKSHISSDHYVMIMPNICAAIGLSSNAVLWQNNTKTQSIQKAGEVLDSLIGQNANIHYIDKMQEPKMKTIIENFITSFGNCIFVQNEQELHASIATNGSSPAILALVAQAIINAGVCSGLHLETSKQLVQKSFEGIAQLLNTKTPQEIKDSITSPNGTTAKALLHCDEHAIQGNITRALLKAVEKAHSKQDSDKP
ncbi:pyrroline-5-carboxylate reductase [Helicobacter aurati]|uniref:Pyrroline-5-carboxylate reductase n=1 Tax=Helicobacter aurati TaxID=137778 RepID=A0A3D8J215_9HELI|nr:pyrroline-5-carboxylate reductase dimerization domain-containing protein [Helicobacter aurati]RDU71246.1 pyrroline-5-carboxylate reductase [Helicobacter aurati]